ncbi:hypothetical protein, partial [Caulobacter sp. 17J65-9]|uniref:hypothetical protein n=1 Tax=Caulobacter sp. 17J65-9 TaxID=2709382 RepID=UPI0013CBC03F
MDDLLEPPAPARRRRVRPVEKVEAPAPAPTTPDAVEIAMELEQGDPSPDSPARRVLVEHARLLKWQVADQRMGVALKALAAVAVVAGLSVAGALLWKGQQSTALVVEAFSTPPALAEQGVTGQAVAARLLDRLARFQAETDTARAPGTFANDWSGEVKVEIPGTGLSIADLDRVLGRSLRRETRVSGELARTPAGGLSLTTRVGTKALSVEGRADTLDALVQQSAEAIYRDTQPYRYAIWLSGQGRAVEAKAAMRDLALNGPIAEQPFALAGYANLLLADGDRRGALRYARRAVEVDPEFRKAWWNISDAQQALGRAEDELVTQRVIQRDPWRHDPKVTRTAESHGRLGAAARERELLGDYAGAAGYAARRTELAEYNGNRVWARAQQIVDTARAHDVGEARRLAELYAPVLADASLSAPVERALAEARGDWAQAAAQGRREL